MLCWVILFSTFSSTAFAVDRYVSLTGSNLNGNGTQALPWQTVGYAVSQSAPGDIIRIGAGDFREQVTIENKNITLIGAGINSTKISAPDNGLSVNIPLYVAVIAAKNATNIVVQNLTVDGRGKGLESPTGGFLGIAYYNGGGRVENCEILNANTTAPYILKEFNHGIYGFADELTTRTLVIKKSKFKNFLKDAIFLQGTALGSGLTFQIDENVIEGGKPLDVFQNGIEVSFGPKGTIFKNAIKDLARITPANDSRVGSAILVFKGGPGIVINQNTITDCQTGVYFVNSQLGTISQNKITMNPSNLSGVKFWSGILLQNASATVSSNELDGGGGGERGSIGIDVATSGPNQTSNGIITNNVVNNFVYGIAVEADGDNTGSCPTAKIKFNSITNSPATLYAYRVCQPQETECNWYGSHVKDGFIQNIYSPSDFIINNWLRGGIDAQLGQIGFQPYNICIDGSANFGCTPGYWKNSQDKAWIDAGYSRGQFFMTVFGITNNQGAVTTSTTLHEALGIGGGGFKKLARHGTAALLNAGQGHYPYAEDAIKMAVKTMFNGGTVSFPEVTVDGKKYLAKEFTSAEALGTYLDQLNNAGCPINNAGEPEGARSGGSQSQLVEMPNPSVDVFSVSAFPNPTRNSFNIRVNTSGSEKVSLRVTDMMGRVVDLRDNIGANNQISFGEKFAAGVYYVEVIQGLNKRSFKLIKEAN